VVKVIAVLLQLPVSVSVCAFFALAQTSTIFIHHTVALSLDNTLTSCSNIDFTDYPQHPSQNSFSARAIQMAGEDDLFVSWGKCFFDSSGSEAPSRYIPCCNSNYGNCSCCESQDMCLSSNACYNGQYGVTYLAGCTDETYQDSTCPNKGEYSGASYHYTLACTD
jgi:hypothetical protein